MFSFYGSKKRIADLYPPLKYDVIIEPFAGAAAYSCLYPERHVRLYDVDPRIIRCWEYLIAATKDDILALPMFGPGQQLDRLNLTAGEFIFLGYMISASTRNPKKTATEKSNWSIFSRSRIAAAVEKIKHWTAEVSDFRKITEAAPVTWFIDPPYEDKGKWYDHRLTDSDYRLLASRVRMDWHGQRIVCEDVNASWLPFSPLVTVGGQSNNLTTEGIYLAESSG